MNEMPTNLRAFSSAQVTRWRPQAAITGAEIALITAADTVPILPGLDLWDSWPLAHEDGRTAVINGRQYWFFLSAECFPDPGQRHDAARIRLASLGADGWRDHGHALPDALTPGSREWAGSAVLHNDCVRVSLFFTAAGRRGQGASFEQRLFVASGVMGLVGPGGWLEPTEAVASDGLRYAVAAEAVGRPGMIKGFRDPAWFLDPATDQRYLLFTGSAGWNDVDYNGVIGLAVQDSGGAWQLADPLIEAVGINNELERPHVIVRDGRYYLFWSTQRRTFNPSGPTGPNGLYAMVADQLAGPYQPVNGSGLVAANPASEPIQGYSWWVTGEGAVWSFVDHWGMQGRTFEQAPELLRGQFGGTAAPVFQLVFAGEHVTIG